MSAQRQLYPRGSVVLVQLDPVRGSEQGKTRPCIVVSDMATIRASRSKPLYAMVPLTRSETLIGLLAPRIKARDGGLPSDSVALCMHVRSIDPGRVVGYVGLLNEDESSRVRTGLVCLISSDWL